MAKEKKVVTIIQARVSSTRLPGKILLPACGEPLLIKMLRRVASSKLAGQIVVATTTSEEDSAIVEICEQNEIEVYRGSKNDLLDRHYQVANKYKADVVVKIPSDCPLIDSAIIDEVIGYYLSEGRFDYVSNLHPGTYPDGNDVEVMSFVTLEKAWENATVPFELEHTTPYIWERPNQFRIGNVKWEADLDYSMSHRWTLDYPEDYEFIKQVYENLYPANRHFTLADILNLLNKQPALKEINQKYAGVNWYRHHLHELKTIDSSRTRIIETVA